MNSKPIPDQKGPLDNEPVALSRATAERVATATRYVERFYRGGTPRPPTVGRQNTAWAIKVITVASINSATALSTPRSGTASLCQWNSTSWQAINSVVTIYNPSTGGSIAASRYVTCNWVGIWEVIMDPCT